jgi:hypothetical protein
VQNSEKHVCHTSNFKRDTYLFDKVDTKENINNQLAL